MIGKPKLHKRITKTTTFHVTLEKAAYDKVLREAAGAPSDANVEIENNYGGDIVVTWIVVEYEGDD